MNLIETTLFVIVLFAVCAVASIATMAGFPVVSLCLLSALVITIAFLIYKGII
tara:strand:- start:2860 stop:3018 length:159 start_codon:yes stop_codon:yes gene_type:complete